MATTAAYADKTTGAGATETKPTSSGTTARPAADSFGGAAGDPTRMAATLRSSATLPTTLLVESLEFGSQRMLAHAAFWQGLMSSTSLPDVLAKQAAFVNEMVSDYRNQAQTVARKVGLPKTR